MSASWDGETVLPSSWYLTQTAQWYNFRKDYWEEILCELQMENLQLECTYCGWRGPWRRSKKSERYYCLDHIIPYIVAPELAFDPDNIAISCNQCNKEKGNKIGSEFVEFLESVQFFNRPKDYIHKGLHAILYG